MYIFNQIQYKFLRCSLIFDKTGITSILQAQFLLVSTVDVFYLRYQYHIIITFRTRTRVLPYAHTHRLTHIDGALGLIIRGEQAELVWRTLSRADCF